MQYVKASLDTEALVITMEEAAEVIQACSKELRFNDNRETLSKEIGDLLCMINILIERDLVDQNWVTSNIALKKEKLKKWSHLFSSASPSTSTSST